MTKASITRAVMVVMESLGEEKLTVVIVHSFVLVLFIIKAKLFGLMVSMARDLHLKESLWTSLDQAIVESYLPRLYPPISHSVLNKTAFCLPVNPFFFASVPDVQKEKDRVLLGKEERKVWLLLCTMLGYVVNSKLKLMIFLIN